MFLFFQLSGGLHSLSFICIPASVWSYRFVLCLFLYFSFVLNFWLFVKKLTNRNIFYHFGDASSPCFVQHYMTLFNILFILHHVLHCDIIWHTIVKLHPHINSIVGIQYFVWTNSSICRACQITKHKIFFI